MKINKILFIIFILINIFFVNVCFASTIPADNASAKEIQKYVNENDLGSISISKLIAWYNINGNSTTTYSKIDQALKGKDIEQIKGFCKGKKPEEIKNSIPKTIRVGVLSKWSESYNSNELKEALNQSNTEYQQDKRKIEQQSTVINPDAFNPTNSTTSDSKAMMAGGMIIGVVRSIGIIVSIGALIVIGIKYMLGSVEEKAQYKQTMIPYLIGAVFLFVGSNIVGMIYDIFL